MNTDETPVSQQDETTDLLNESLCLNCKARPFAEGSKTRICDDCRQIFIKYPIPKWIWIFTGIILLVMVIGLTRMPKYFSAAVHLGRGEKAMEEQRYYTAQKELEMAAEIFPENIEINAKLFIASAKNINYPLISKSYNQIVDRNFEDAELLAQVQLMASTLQNYNAADTNIVNRINTLKDSVALLVHEFETLSPDNEDYLIAGAMIGNHLYDLEKYAEAEKVLNTVLEKNDSYYHALSLLSAVKRNMGKFDEAIALCDRLLEKNKEDVTVLAQKARIELKRKDDKQAAVYADEALSIDPTSLYALEAKAMVAYYLNHKDESKQILNTIRQKEIESGDTTITNRLQLILNGTESYR